MGQKRILVCSPRMPEFDRQSGERRIFNTIEFLLEAGWAVTFLAHNVTDGEHYGHVLQQRGVETYVGPRFWDEQTLRARRFDIAYFAFWHIAEAYLPMVRRVSPQTRVIVDSIDLHFVRTARQIIGRSGGRLGSDYGQEIVRELNTYAAADAVIAVSQKESDLINDLTGLPSLAHTLPDSEALTPSTIPYKERKGILFIGNFWHAPNVEAAEFLCRQILPKLPRRITNEHPVYMVGNQLDDRIRALGKGLPYVRMVGWVPSVVPYLEQSRISVIPLLYGAGTKRKLIQGLMIGTPTVSTTVGIEGLDLVDEEHVLVADEPDRFADSIVRLIEDRDLWNKLARQGAAHVSKLRSWDAARERLKSILAYVMNQPVKREEPPPPSTATSAIPAPMTYDRYQGMARQIHEVVRNELPDGATVAVVSKGDDALIKFEGRTGWHFPRDAAGNYSGYYPADSAAAIAHLEEARRGGAGFFLLPSTASWWLDHYADFRRHLESNYAAVVQNETCTIFSLEAAQGKRKPVSASAKDRTDTRALSSSGNGDSSKAPVHARNGNGAAAARQKQLVAGLAPAGHQIKAPSVHRGGGPRILVLGVYMASEKNHIDHIVSTLSASASYDVVQRWLALGGQPPNQRVADVTTGVLFDRRPKFKNMNDLLEEEDLSQYEYILLADDDVTFCDQWVDRFFDLQSSLEFRLAQPARTSNSTIDHPIVEQQRGAVARETLFVEIGPVVSFHRSAFDFLLPFDLTSSMGWGYENVWSRELSRRGMKMGIIDATPVDHSLRPVATLYTWGGADQGRTDYLAKHKDHRPLDECFTVLRVIN